MGSHLRWNIHSQLVGTRCRPLFRFSDHRLCPRSHTSRVSACLPVTATQLVLRESLQRVHCGINYGRLLMIRRGTPLAQDPDDL